MSLTSWWFQPLWNILVKTGSSTPIFGVNIKKYLSCHNLENLSVHKRLEFMKCQKHFSWWNHLQQIRKQNRWLTNFDLLIGGWKKLHRHIPQMVGETWWFTMIESKKSINIKHKFVIHKKYPPKLSSNVLYIRILPRAMQSICDGNPQWTPVCFLHPKVLGPSQQNATGSVS